MNGVTIEEWVQIKVVDSIGHLLAIKLDVYEHVHPPT